MNFENLYDIAALILVALFLIGMIVFAVVERMRTGGRNLRNIPAFAHLIRSIGLAVEDGARLHVTLGRGEMTGANTAAELVGLSVLDRVARTASISDFPPTASAGDGAVAILARDTLAAAYREMDANELYDPTAGRLAGVTPFSYAAGTIPMIRDENVSATILAGSFGSEVALITEAAERSDGYSIAGTDNIPSQAVLYAAAQDPLIGEELFAAGAYLRSGIWHIASLRVQDIARWVIVVVILGGALLKIFGVIGS